MSGGINSETGVKAVVRLLDELPAIIEMASDSKSARDLLDHFRREKRAQH